MQQDILINWSPQETRVAVVEQGAVQELHVERSLERGLVGNVYLGKVARVLPGMQSAFIDIGLERAAFLHVADVWQRWPIADDSADVVLSVFSPRNFIETERVMKPGSVLIVVTPEENHLVELRTKFNALGIERDKSEKIAKSLKNFTNIHQSVHESSELLNGSAQCDALLSGPNGHHISAEDMELLRTAESINVTHCVNISVWKLC